MKNVLFFAFWNFALLCMATYSYSQESSWILGNSKLVFDKNGFSQSQVACADGEYSSMRTYCYNQKGYPIVGSSGCDVADTCRNVINGGESLNGPDFQTSFCIFGESVYFNSSSALWLNDTLSLIIFLKYFDAFPGALPAPIPYDLSCAEIIKGKDGKYYVDTVYTLINDTLSRENLVVYRRDDKSFELFIPEYNSSNYYRLSISIENSLKLQLYHFSSGIIWSQSDWIGQCDISPNYDYYARIDSSGVGIHKIIDNEFVLVNKFQLPGNNRAFHYLQFSHNSKYLYLGKGRFIYRLSKENNWSIDEIELIYERPVSKPPFYHMKRTPNGKILVSDFEFSNFISVLDFPDCEFPKFEDSKINLVWNKVTSLPNPVVYPNSSHLECDSTSSIKNIGSNECDIRVMNNSVYFNENISRIEIYSLDGRCVSSQMISKNKSVVQIGELYSGYSPNMYIVKLMDINNNICVKKCFF